MKMLKMCLNWKVLAALAAVGVGTYAVAPGLALAALPVLLLAACPISMLIMMYGMQGSHGGQVDDGLTREEQISRLRTQQAVLADRIGTLEHEPDPSGDGRPVSGGGRR